MSRLSCAALASLLLAACAPANAVGTPLRGAAPTASFVCTPMTNLRARFNATSLTLFVDGEGPFTLPQVTGRSDYTVYSDGEHVFQIYESQVSFGIGRGRLRPCARG